MPEVAVSEVIDGMVAHWFLSWADFSREQAELFHGETPVTHGRLRVCLVTLGAGLVVGAVLLVLLAVMLLDDDDEGLEPPLGLTYHAWGLLATLVAGIALALGGIFLACSFVGCNDAGDPDDDFFRGHGNLFLQDELDNPEEGFEDGSDASSDGSGSESNASMSLEEALADDDPPLDQVSQLEISEEDEIEEQEEGEG